MFLHIGGDIVVPEADIIGVFDLENTTINRHGRKFLNMAQKNGEVITAVAEEIPKSYIISSDGENHRVYLSPIYTQALKRRSDAKARTEDTRRKDHR